MEMELDIKVTCHRITSLVIYHSLTMKIILLAVVLIAAVHGRPQGLTSLAKSALASITKFDNIRNELGEYVYNVETSDGQKRYESRKVINPGTKDEEAIVEGFYSYPGEDGKEVLVGYKSDKDGYQPEGEHLPNSANARRRPPQVGIPSSAISTLAGGGLGR